MTSTTRKLWLAAAAVVLASDLSSAQRGGVPAQLQAASVPDLRSLISKADLDYARPVPRSEEGMPLGNGRMGSLVWTTPSSLKFQINRVDVQPMNRDTRSFFERNSDYMGGCGFVDVELAGAGGDALPDAATTEHLSVYDGLMTLKSPGLSAQLLAWHAHDVMAVAVDDERPTPQPLQINLRMLRFLSQDFGAQLESMIASHTVTVRTREHTAASTLIIRGNRIALLQEFKEGTHVAKSAVVVGITGREATPRFANETEVRLVAPAARGRAVVLIATAASLNAADDVVGVALKELDAAVSQDFSALAADNGAWWHAFWERGSIDLHSADGTADFVASNYHYYLYLMAATSRGAFPPKFNGMLWNTAGDFRVWGAQHWFANLSCYYEALFEANRLDLLDPVFAMYSGMFDAAATAARQQWGSEGIFIPETTWYDGLATLPDDIAAEMRELYLIRKPWEQRSDRFRQFASTQNPYSSRWNWIGGGKWVEGRWEPAERGFGPFGPVTHNLGTTGKVAYLYWRRYEYTLDEAWLRDRAYPMLKGAAELYRNFPNLSKGADGKYHIHHVNSNESVMGANDTDEDLSAMRGVLAAAIRANTILGEDAALRAQWQEMLANLAPLPTSDQPDATKAADYTGPPVFVRAIKPVASGNGFTPDGNSLPMWFFDLVNLDASDKHLLATANATFDRVYRMGIGPATEVGVLSKMAIAGTSLGRVDATRFLVPNQMRGLTAERASAYRGGGVLANRMALREGAQALDAERLGRASDALQLALLQSAPGVPGGDSTIALFPAWPDEWDARFTLRARGGFVVIAARSGGQTQTVEIRSESGATCRLRNPWGTSRVAISRNGARWREMSGPLLTVETAKGDLVKIERVSGLKSQVPSPSR
jgi:hypothetical protein